MVCFPALSLLLWVMVDHDRHMLYCSKRAKRKVNDLYSTFRHIRYNGVNAIIVSVCCVLRRRPESMSPPGAQVRTARPKCNYVSTLKK